MDGSPPSSDGVSHPPETGDLRRKLVQGGGVLAVLVLVVAGIVVAVPGLSGVRSAIAGASAGWILVACAIQLAGLAGAVLFVQLVFEELPRRLSWWQGWGMEGANAVLPTAGGTTVSYLSVRALRWDTYRFARRTAVMIIAPAAPNVVLIMVLGVGMGLGVFAGSNDWWLTWLPALIAAVVAAGAIAVAVWAERLAARIRNRRLAQGVTVVATGVTGTVAILRRRNWRVLGTWVDLFGSIGALWASLIAVGDHLPFAIVAMGYLVGQIAQAIPVPGGIGAIDAGVTGALVLYGAPATITTAGELIAHGIALLLPIATGAIAVSFLRHQIADAKARHEAEAAARPASA
jgi:uncharacterized membrane protein YbhN (UPF0104 family)